MLVGTFAVQVKSKSLLRFWNSEWNCKTFWLDTLDFLIDNWGQSKTLNFKQVDEYELVGYQVICEAYWNKKQTKNVVLYCNVYNFRVSSSFNRGRPRNIKNVSCKRTTFVSLGHVFSVWMFSLPLKLFGYTNTRIGTFIKLFDW